MTAPKQRELSPRPANVINLMPPDRDERDRERKSLDELDMIREIERATDLYRGTDKQGQTGLSLYNVPSYVLTTIDMIKVNHRSVNGVSINTIVAFCVYHGLPVIRNNEHMTELTSAKNALYRSEAVRDTWQVIEIEELSPWFKSFDVRTGNRTGSKFKPLSVKIPDYIGSALSSASDDLGMTQSMLGVICIMTGLRSQTKYVGANYRNELDDSIEGFFKRIELRARVSNLLLEGLL